MTRQDFDSGIGLGESEIFISSGTIIITRAEDPRRRRKNRSRRREIESAKGLFQMRGGSRIQQREGRERRG
eukprot:6200623-Pleurochrysis_carterae.AAC.1